MQDSLKSNDEIDLSELFLTIWAYKFFIACTCALGLVISGYYALNQDRLFTSATIFKLDQGEPRGISFGGELDFAGIKGMNLSSNLPIDQIMGRIFIEQINDKINLKDDPYFNTYNPNSIDPIWKSIIKRAIGWQTLTTDIQEAMWQNIVANYSKNVEMELTSEGSFKISVTHLIPQRAAEIANIIMNKIILDSKNKKDKNRDQMLSYLSNTLAESLSDLEKKQSKLKEFTLKNSALPLENFTAESLELDKLRENLSRTSQLHKAVDAVSILLQNKTTGQNDYLALRKKFPIVDQVEFRRILGQNEIINSWSWPEASSVDAIFNTLSERKNRLQSQINILEIDAEQSSQLLETYVKLKREAVASEASYTVLIEQVKAQSMVAGFKAYENEIYEYASASINPSSPNRKLILTIGAISGLFLGAALSLIFARNRGVYYSKNSLNIESQAQITASIRSLLPLRNKNLDEVNKILKKKPRSILRNIAVKIQKNAATQVVLTSSHAKLTSNDIAQALASYMQSNTMKVGVINFSSQPKKLNIDDDALAVGSFIVTKSIEHISVLTTGKNLTTMEFLIRRDFWKDIQSLNSTFDLVFLCADNSDAISLLTALEGQKIFHIMLARTKKTKSANLLHMRSLLPIQGLLHE